MKMKQSDLDGRRKADAPWDSPDWRELADPDHAARCRLLQGRWRVNRKVAPEAGMSIPTGNRPPKLVVSMLPVPHGNRNFLTDAAAEALQNWKQGGAGLVSEERFQRNLLSSQPLAFNLFAPFSASTEARQLLLPWVKTIDDRARSIVAIELESAPDRHTTFGGGSAFDVRIDYRTSETEAFLGVEVKYAEDLRKSGIKSIAKFEKKTRDKSTGQVSFLGRPKPYVEYQRFTERRDSEWVDGAVTALDKPELRQFWLNALLMQKVSANERKQGISVVLTCLRDEAARAAAENVKKQLRPERKDTFVWSSFERLLKAVDEPPTTSPDLLVDFRSRYLDFESVESVRSRHLDALPS